MTRTASSPAPLADASPSGHLPTLDGVRGIAVLWVVMHNISVVDDQGWGGLGRLFEDGLVSGWMAVTLFFALSGFLITGILLDSREDPHYYRSFYTRRALRIFPLYYLVLLVAFVLVPLVMQPPARLAHDIPNQIWLWAYLSNWTEPYSISSQAFPHFWSLAVEEQFYLVWPFLVRRCNPRDTVRLCVGLAAAALAARCAMFAGGASLEALYTFTFSRMDALVLGGAAAAALRIPSWRNWLAERPGSVLLAAAVLLGACLALVRSFLRLNATMQTVGYTLLAGSFALLILGLAAADLSRRDAWWVRPWRSQPLRVLAKYSYGMYVFHKILADTVGRPLMRAHESWLRSMTANAVYVIAGTLTTLGVAVLSYHLVEKRFLRLRPLPARPRGLPAVAT